MEANKALRAFFDTNVIVYARLETGPKVVTANRVLRNGGSISVQVLNEFAHVAHRKFRRGWPELREIVTLLQVGLGPAFPATTQTQYKALGLAERYGYTIYDANIIASALLNGCDTLYSEDMQDGQQIETLLIRNPFTATTP